MIGRILVIDDELITQKLLSVLFKKFGFEVTLASTAEEALHQLQNEEFSMITCDWMMPGFSGLELLKRIKKNPEWSNIPVVMISAADEKDELQTAVETGAVGIIKKPFSAAVLQQMLKDVLGVEF